MMPSNFMDRMFQINKILPFAHQNPYKSNKQDNQIYESVKMFRCWFYLPRCQRYLFNMYILLIFWWYGCVFSAHWSISINPFLNFINFCLFVNSVNRLKILNGKLFIFLIHIVIKITSRIYLLSFDLLYVDRCLSIVITIWYQLIFCSHYVFSYDMTHFPRTIVAIIVFPLSFFWCVLSECDECMCGYFAEYRGSRANVYISSNCN